jgi:hypothetical protein
MNLGCKTTVVQCGAQRFQILVFAILYCAFAVVMNNHGALFGLEQFMLAYFDQAANNMVKRVHFIVEDYKLILFYL